MKTNVQMQLASSTQLEAKRNLNGGQCFFSMQLNILIAMFCCNNFVRI